MLPGACSDWLSRREDDALPGARLAKHSGLGDGVSVNGEGPHLGCNIEDLWNLAAPKLRSGVVSDVASQRRRLDVQVLGQANAMQPLPHQCAVEG